MGSEIICLKSKDYESYQYMFFTVDGKSRRISINLFLSSHKEEKHIWECIFIPLLYVTHHFMARATSLATSLAVSQSLLLCVLDPAACAKNCVIQCKTQVRARDRYTQKVNMFVILRRDILPSVFDLENCFRNLLNSRFSMQDAHTK